METSLKNQSSHSKSQKLISHSFLNRTKIFRSSASLRDLLMFSMTESQIKSRQVNRKKSMFNSYAVNELRNRKKSGIVLPKIQSLKQSSFFNKYYENGRNNNNNKQAISRQSNFSKLVNENFNSKISTGVSKKGTHSQTFNLWKKQSYPLIIEPSKGVLENQSIKQSYVLNNGPNQFKRKKVCRNVLDKSTQNRFMTKSSLQKYFCGSRQNLPMICTPNNLCLLSKNLNGQEDNNRQIYPQMKVYESNQEENVDLSRDVVRKFAQKKDFKRFSKRHSEKLFKQIFVWPKIDELFKLKREFDNKDYPYPTKKSKTIKSKQIPNLEKSYVVNSKPSNHVSRTVSAENLNISNINERATLHNLEKKMSKENFLFRKSENESIEDYGYYRNKSLSKIEIKSNPRNSLIISKSNKVIKSTFFKETNKEPSKSCQQVQEIDIVFSEKMIQDTLNITGKYFGQTNAKLQRKFEELQRKKKDEGFEKVWGKVLMGIELFNTLNDSKPTDSSKGPLDIS